MRIALLFLIPVVAALAQEKPKPEPGPVPVDIASPRPLVVFPREGDVHAALAAFLDAHAKHKAGHLDEALFGYLAFLGMPGRRDLPQRYVKTAQRRLDALLANVRKRYAAALATYRKDRAQGLAELDAFAHRYARLPEGEAALALVQSDRLRTAIETAKELAAHGRKTEAANGLEKAIRALPAGLYLYEAKKLLITLGGPDLFERGEDGAAKGDPEEKRAEKKKAEEPEIEISGD